jgi:endonuclease III
VPCHSCNLCSALINWFLSHVFHFLVQIILSQEKNIHRLNELVRSLRQQLQQCRHNNETSNDNESPLTEHVIELERQQILEN